MTHTIKKLAKQLQPQLVAIRRQIHQCPELGQQEYATAEFIAKQLGQLGLAVQTQVGGTGVVALIEGTSPGKTLLLRADMDALPIVEQTQLEYGSQYPGKMHACGHDAHIAILLGAAMLLTQLKQQLQGNVKLLFQPSEERPCGAKAMIEAGVLQNPTVDAAIATHVWPDLPSGCYGWREGALMAAPDFFKITLHGKGGHGSQPERCVDPILIGHQIYQQLQLIPSRILGALQPAVVTVTEFSAGNSPNIIPNTCQLQGTVRTLDNAVRLGMPALLRDIIQQITQSSGATYQLQYHSDTPVLVNHPHITGILRSSISSLWGAKAAVEIQHPSMSGEDFALYLNHIPGALFFTGIQNPHCHSTYALHHPKFTVDEEVLSPTAALLAHAAWQYLAEGTGT